MAKRAAGKSAGRDGRKRTQAGSAKNGAGRRERQGLPRNLREIYGVLLLMASLLLFLGFFFSSLGPVGRGLEWFFSYLLGYVRFVLPFLMLLLGVTLFFGRLGGMEEGRDGWRLTWVEMAGIAVLMLAVCALLHLGKGPPEVMFEKERLFAGGGLLGAVICWPLVKLVSRAGAYVLVVGMLIVGFLLFTGLTVSQYLQERVERRRRERERERSLAQGRRREGEGKGREEEPEKPPQRRPGVSRAETDALVAQASPPLVTQERVPASNLVVEEGGQMAIEVVEEDAGRTYRLPPLELLVRSLDRSPVSHKSVNESISVLEKTLRDFGVDAAVTHVTRGPTVTRFEVELGSGVKVNRVLSLSDDIAYAMASPDIRIITPIPGKSALGIEIPNRERDLVSLGDILATPQARKVRSPLRVGLGMDISGNPVIVDLRDMPHLLLAGATNTGKSCCINAMITSVLMTSPPQEVRMLLIDPKYVELSHFNGLPHLLAPVVTDPKKASGALSWLVREMEQRYQVLSRAGVKNLVAYKDALREGLQKEVDDKGERLFPPMPYILVCIDELAELMLVSLAEVEDSIARIAQMARAVGIHLVVATQRPSVDVVTGIIKANMPSRIAFKVASQADSRVILDMGGAEKLVGHGDMLFLHPGSSRPVRLQGAFISEREIAAIVAYIKRQRGADYREDILEEVGADRKEQLREDELLEEAMEVVVRSGMASASLLQRKLRIGYARAARLVDLLEDHGVVGGYEGSKPRAVLMTPEELEERKRREAEA
ncbi:MAG: DNA translocase FtsK 4TM domain-containing protein [Actinobacteria bacterium]|nr:DNA translocase FtsK 4TM domain-containing protein [Actinomycetota bacterium]